jgi:hypothetical protein
MGHLPLENSMLFSSTCGERIATGKGKRKGKVHPRTGHEGQEGE